MSKYLKLLSKIHWSDFFRTLDHPTGLKLDIYYSQYRFATKVQEEQHEKYIKFFHNSNPNNFIKQQVWDQLKKELCKENWIALRYVWYYKDPLLTTQVFHSFSSCVTRNAVVSSSSITKSHLVISWPARKSVLFLGFLRCVSLGWVASSSLLKLNKSSYKSMMTLIRSRDK